MVVVVVREGNVEQAIRTLKKKLNREGRFREMRDRRYHEKPTTVRRRKKAEAVRRARKVESKRRAEVGHA